MSYIEKRNHKNGKISYRARVRQAGSPDISQSFASKREATIWTQRMEAEIRAGRYFGRDESKEKTFAEFVERYAVKEWQWLKESPLLRIQRPKENKAKEKIVESCEEQDNGLTILSNNKYA